MVFATHHGLPKFPGTIFGHSRFFFRAHYRAHFLAHFRAHFRAHHMCILAHDVAHYDGKDADLADDELLVLAKELRVKEARIF